MLIYFSRTGNIPLVLFFSIAFGRNERQRNDVSAPIPQRGEAADTDARRLRRAARELRGSARDARLSPDDCRLVQSADGPRANALCTVPASRLSENGEPSLFVGPAEARPRAAAVPVASAGARAHARVSSRFRR